MYLIVGHMHFYLGLIQTQAPIRDYYVDVRSTSFAGQAIGRRLYEKILCTQTMHTLQNRSLYIRGAATLKIRVLCHHVIGLTLLFVLFLFFLRRPL